MSTDQWLDLALDAPNPDERRRGVNGLANGRDAADDAVVKAFDTIARTDPDPMVRCAAVRALAHSIGPERVPTILKILKSANEALPDVRPASGPVRWEAARLLLLIVDQYAYDEEQRDEIVTALLDRAAREDDRDARLASIDALAYFAERRVMDGLIEALGSDDFAIRRACELALAALTGQTHEYDADAWRAWLSTADDPFVHAGEIPPGIHRESNDSWWPW